MSRVQKKKRKKRMNHLKKNLGKKNNSPLRHLLVADEDVRNRLLEGKRG